MTRAFAEELLLFLLPFAVFALWLTLLRRSPLSRVHWGGRVPVLVLVGLGLAIGWLAWTGFTAPRGKGAYVPAHMENGTFVPGRLE